MEFHVSDFQGHKLAQGQTDNPFTIRNCLRQFLEPPVTVVTPHVIVTRSRLKIWCSAELAAIMQDSPLVINNVHTPPPLQLIQPQIDGPVTTLAQLCRNHRLKPAKARRILRKHYGVRKLRYEWADSEVQIIIALLLGGK